MSDPSKISIDDYVSQIEGNLVSDMDGEKVMLNIDNGKYYNMGTVGGYIWILMDNPIMVTKIIAQLIEEYNVEREECEKEVLAFLNHLLKESLIYKSKQASIQV
ncbi:lasso peptide biosynthesis PqqD family chaperone [Bacillus carboniphilus]|uniref:Lasso peptide biosynthesis PqqD family chaperone n=1 Tax=Bacillus carboniphilus TaxID=86663 RepID=A0ABY9JTR3_9BACI|nr:lasso peptide biosynthesis PqqD family chaperone [Bacillus carboniphilus]WLR42775.1 lasso peptide biosynthesis PqqD family chaperone [Bacillus carboniphilus]